MYISEHGLLFMLYCFRYCHRGRTYHDGRVGAKELPKWGQGSILGVHLDTWRWTMEFYLNREPLGIVFSGR